MADIDVVPKRGTNIWIWIIAAILLALVLFALFGAFADNTPTVGHLMSTDPTVGVSTISAFL